MPWASGSKASAMPTTDPSIVTTGPPELPGLIAVSVCIMSSNHPLSVVISLPSPETVPSVSVFGWSEGNPTAAMRVPGDGSVCANSNTCPPTGSDS
jgi:hypothetical protein